LFEGPPRKPESRLTQRDMDLAASVQQVTEEAMLRMTRHVHQRTGLPNLCLAGGVALNCVANGRVLRDGRFKNLWIQPAAGDAGGAIGAALLAWHQIMDRPRTPVCPDAQHGSFLGPAYSSDDVRNFLDRRGAKYRRIENEDELCREVARLLDEGCVVGHVAGRMEFGPRALGHRSVLGDARRPDMQATMNMRIKFRESFRPFAPSCLAERAGDYFDLDAPSPYMLLTAPVAERWRRPADNGQRELSGIDRLHVVRSEVPAVTHVDYSARVQTVDARQSPRLHGILRAFEQRTGTPLLVNTSFNIRGEPIVCTPEEAYRCFMYTDIDALVLEDCLCLKQDQPPLAGAEQYKRQFRPD
jgi:carbamoyltransferase